MCCRFNKATACVTSALSQESCNAGGMITGVRFSSWGLWTCFITGVLVDIHSQHGKTDRQPTRYRVCPELPKASNT